MATGWKKRGREMKRLPGGSRSRGDVAGGHGLTVQVVVLLALRVRQSKKLLQQERVLQDPLDGFDEVRLECGRMLLLRVLGI